MEATTGEQIAAVLHAASVLVVRHLSYGQTLTALSVLGRLDNGDPARISELATATGVSQPSMTELVGRMQRQGRVARFSDPEDGRATLVRITASGRAHLLQMQGSLRDRLVELLDMPAEDQAALSLRVASPLIEQLTQLAVQDPQSPRDRVPLMS